MNRESYKTKRQGQPKRNSKVKGTKRRSATKSIESSIYTQPQLAGEYRAKAEWVHNVMPKLKE
jgi:hypothetical protein